MSLASGRATQVPALDWAYGTQNLLAHVRGPGPDCGFRSAAVVGAGGDRSDLLRQLVGGLPQRLVLTSDLQKVPDSDEGTQGTPLPQEKEMEMSSVRARPHANAQYRATLVHRNTANGGMRVVQ